MFPKLFENTDISRIHVVKLSLYINTSMLTMTLKCWLWVIWFNLKFCHLVFNLRLWFNIESTIYISDYPIFLTPEDYPSADLTQAKERCAQCDMQLCSLAQLKAAYDVGYRNDEWGLYDTPGRDVKVMPCAGWFNAGECYYTEEGYLKSSIPNTPRVGVADSVYCCDA